MSLLARRNLLIGLIAAPAIVRASSLMPVRSHELMTKVEFYDHIIPTIGNSGIPMATTARMPERLAREILSEVRAGAYPHVRTALYSLGDHWCSYVFCNWKDNGSLTLELRESQ